jgi:hypothetical protein
MMSDQSIFFLNVLPKDIIEYIHSAKKRIIFAKPAFMKSEVDALSKAFIVQRIKPEIFMESGDSAIRYGFGESSALDIINKEFDSFSIHSVEKIRMGILVIDNIVLIYMPEIAFDSNYGETTFPNGILLEGKPAENIISLFSPSSNNSNVVEHVDNIAILPGGFINTISEEVVKENIQTVIKMLNENPAVNPANLKKISYYRNNYKILKMQVNGIKLENKRISLKPFYSLLPEINQKLKSSWTVFSKEDIESLQDTKNFQRELDKIEKQYLLDAGRFGNIISIDKKQSFINAVERLKYDFIQYLSGNSSDEIKKRFISDNDTKNKKDAKTILESSRKQLEEYLFSMCSPSDEFLERIFKKYRHIKESLNSNQINIDQAFKEFVRLYVINDLRFTDFDEMLSAIDIKHDFYDISDELINDPDFAALIDKYGLDLRENSEGFRS